MTKFIITAYVCILLMAAVFSQGEKGKNNDNTIRTGFRILFYNTENFFDTIDDTKTDDNDFLPASKYHWTGKRYHTKVNNLYKVLISNGIEPPSIIGLAEVENQKVLNDLVFGTPLSKFHYRIIHFESPDNRGIDVALLYRTDKFKPIISKPVELEFPFDLKHKSRDILYVKGIALNTDTLHIFVNHWPSRAGGQAQSEKYRIFAAERLRACADSVFRTSSSAKIIIIGDFNDEPDDISIHKFLKAKKLLKSVASKSLYNLSYGWLKSISLIGTHKYKGNWALLDQIIVSGTLLSAKSKGLISYPNAAVIYSPQFLLKDDTKNSGVTPFRTFEGYRYVGGFSDHLPVYLDLQMKK
jgi:predicted extracellular nuclease